MKDGCMTKSKISWKHLQTWIVLFNNLSQGKKNVLGIGDVMMAMNFFENMNAKSNVKNHPLL